MLSRHWTTYMVFYKQWFHAKKYGKNGEVTIRINLAPGTSMNLRVTLLNQLKY